VRVDWRAQRQIFVNLKAKPEDVLFLTEQYEAITPGYHMNKLHWISVDISDSEVDDMLKDLVCQSYLLVIAKLPKKQQLSLQNGVD
jgi:predicted DNA-binding protein (MmcQ/YjbR family)